jgi:hypothetical protein
MSFLNGDLGGSLTAPISFDSLEIKDTVTIKEKYTIRHIIREAVHAWGLEPYHNIIINDLDENAIELLEYRGDSPMYLLYNVKHGCYENFTMNGEMKCYDANSGK